MVGFEFESREPQGCIETICSQSDFSKELRLPSSVHHLRNGEKVIAFGFVARNQVIGSGYGIGAIRAHLLVPPIMQQDDVAATNLPCDLALDHGGRRGVPVIPGSVQQDRLKAKLA